MAGPDHAVFICSSPRTGSGVLCSALWSTGLCGRPDEYLAPGTRREYEAAWGTDGDDTYVEHVLVYATTPNGVCSMKVHAGDLGLGGHWWSRSRRTVAAMDPYVEAASRVHFYWLRRRDSVRQAVSLFLARETGRYRSFEGTAEVAADELPVRASTIRALIRQIERWDAGWSRYFDDRGIVPASIWYEDDIEEHYSETARAVLETVGIEDPPEMEGTTPYRKQSDAVSEALVARFRGLSRAPS